ncbi:hypothetical protein GCM10027275_50560 [Rhabdobacter roseus]|uniref:Septal ring factor EnvC (AmiA/AmiB activator) n=1 Tax=Rhabdobacter roseus TaxID=1655419 RepID=A0A840U5M5_9BACT|nr:hypothetical protein [Rhabdobacter roseus]MBB5287129.1 septal ring factor EnvC (AmiA/AmiB activator) [Rhabdobacter roseus]
MSKPTGLAGILASLFPSSNQPLSEKLSTEEFNAFSGEVNELNQRLAAQKEGNEKVTADLAAAQQQLTEATTKLTAAEKQATELQGQLSAVTTERDKYKAYYDKAAGVGTQEPTADENSRGRELTSYNQHAREVYHQVHGK